MGYEKIIETNRLILRPFHTSDTLSCFKCFGQDNSLGKYLVMFPMKNMEEMTIWVNSISNNQNIWLVIEKTSMNPIGYVSIDVPYEILKNGEIAYFIGEKYQRKGYAYEALRSVLEYLFIHRDLYLIEASVNENNIGSKMLLEKLGFLLEATLRGRRVNLENGERNSLMIYSLLKCEYKLTVLSKIAHVLNENGIVWAIGASLLLYFKNKTDHFNDIDIMVFEDDVEKLKEALSSMGELAPPNPDKKYKTRHFLEFTIDGVDIDVMAGFVIVKDDVEYDCSLKPEQIVEYIQVNNEKIPLQSIMDWRRYYDLMGRTAKVEMIER